MTEPPVQDEKLHREIALFRFRIIADLVQLPPGSPGIGAKLHAKAEEDYAIPGTHRTRVASETMRDWLQLYRRGGFDALYPKPRADRGQPRRLPPEVAELLVAIKSEHLTWSVRQVIQSARDSNQLPNGVQLPASTVHRLLTREGLMLKRTDEPLGVDRRRFTYQYAGELWMSDVMHGPTVGDGRQRHKSYLIAFIDDATRVIPYAAFARAENTVAFLPVLKQALIRRGIPHRLFVDNGANYRSQQLALVCAKLGIALIHARPYQPAGKGKIERWFRTVRSQFLTTLQATDTASLDAIRRRFHPGQGANARVGGSLHRASSQPLYAAFAPARAGVSCRYRCFSHPFAIVPISYHPDAARGAFTLVRSRLLFLSF